jgi:hypothetical protein
MSGSLTSFAQNALGPAVGAGINAIINTTSGFRTRPAGPLPPAIYALSIRGATPPYAPFFYYYFPISPSNITKEVVGMGNFYDVAGPTLNFGVQRIVDVYGEAPPILSIAGTTGVKYHSTDGGFLTGLESIQILQAAISQYFAAVTAASTAGAGAAGNSLPRLEFYDYFTSSFYQVVPLGSQGIRQDSRTPQLLFYNFRFVVVENLETALIGAIDSMLGPLGQGIDSAINGVSQSLGSALGSYSPFSALGS